MSTAELEAIVTKLDVNDPLRQAIRRGVRWAWASTTVEVEAAIKESDV